MAAWTVDPWLTAWLLFVGIVYLRGFVPRCRRGAAAFRPWRAVSFCGGLLAAWVALSSPLDAYGSYLLSAHMGQHLLLMMVVPPLILAGNPGIPLLMGVSRAFRAAWIKPLMASRRARRLFALLVHPVVGWLSLALVTWIWHLPALYELGLVSTAWHRIEHACFLLASFSFWWSVVQPYPSKPRLSQWVVLIYLLTADVQNTLFSAIFVFAENVIYPAYSATSPGIGVDPLRDQALAGAVMWVAGSVAFLVPVAVIIGRIFSKGRPEAVRLRQLRAAGVSEAIAGAISLPVLQATPRTNVPRRWIRVVLRVVLLGAAALIVLDGLLGPRTEAMNAAGVLPFTHWRGALVLTLLLAGNVFCSICPFLAPSMALKRFVPGISRLQRRWPARLRSKWIAVVLVVVWLWAYEAFALWASPVATAWIIVGYFVAAFVVDSFFKGASFCKWLCPIGQFNFVASMISPIEVRALDPGVCASCTTRECIRGNESAKVAGCGLDLYIPAKVGNLDCTMCLDCADACPYNNVRLGIRSRTWDLVAAGWRSSLGRLSRRSDLAALVLVIVFGAFANAMGMVGPVLSWEDSVALWLGFESRLVPASIFVLGVIVVAPVVLVVLTGGRSWRRVAFGLVPIGFAMWLVHFGFHFATSAGTAVSVVQRMALDIGVTGLGVPEWIWGCCVILPDWLLPVEILALDVGLVGSLVAVWQIAERRWRIAGLWMGAAVVLFAVGVWIVLQPMEMRGTVL
jgi:cytochrome c oxidase assembly factor CtaG/polyferredoxin